MFTMQAFDMMLDSTPVGYAYHELIYNENGMPVDIKIIDYNPAYLNILGITEKEAKYNSMFNLFPSLKQEMPSLLDTLTEIIALNSHEYFSGFIPSFGKWVNIHFFSPQKNFFIAQLLDLTEGKRLESQLIKKTNELEELINLIPDLVGIINFSGELIGVNQSWERILGYRANELQNSSIVSYLHPDDFISIKDSFEDGTIFEPNNLLRSRLLSKEGHWVYIDWNITFYEDHLYCVGRDVTNLIKKEEEIYFLSFHDKLTGLYNRAYFEEELKRLDNNRNLPLAIIMGDVNGLKIINDVFGHLAGDKMLIAIGDILRTSCRKGDIIARWGGDEFIILLPNTAIENVKEIIQRIMTNCKNNELDLQYVNISLGYAIKESTDINIIDVLVEAENNMYKNKVIEGKIVREIIIASMIQFLFDGNYEIKYHIDRIRNYSRLMAKELNLSKKEECKLLQLADTHDIGKISLSKELLSSTGKLSESEWEEMKKHSETGYRIAKSIPELMEVSDLILYHHEHWDGKGYPHGLKGEEIPYLARIFSIIDVYDAITQDKPYRKAISNEEAKEYLISQKEKQFDPNIVDAFIKIISRKRGD